MHSYSKIINTTYHINQVYDKPHPSFTNFDYIDVQKCLKSIFGVQIQQQYYIIVNNAINETGATRRAWVLTATPLNSNSNSANSTKPNLIR